METKSMMYIWRAILAGFIGVLLFAPFGFILAFVEDVFGNPHPHGLGLSYILYPLLLALVGGLSGVIVYGVVVVNNVLFWKKLFRVLVIELVVLLLLIFLGFKMMGS